MRRPFLSVIIPTIGREPGLLYALESVVHQTRIYERVELVVVGDSFGRRDLSSAYQTAKAYGARWYLHDGGSSCFGQQQRQFGMQRARGRWLAFLADDDIWLPGALDAIAIATSELERPKPLLFRVNHWLGWPIWDMPALMPGHVDANCVVAPNDPMRLGQWGLRYEGDYDFIRSTARLYDDDVVFRGEIIGVCRPNEDDIWTHRERSKAELVL